MQSQQIGEMDFQLGPASEEQLYPRVLGSRLPRNNSNASVVGMITHLDQKQRKLILEVDAVNKNTIEVTIPVKEPAQLRGLKFIEIRGVSKKDGTLELRDYTNFHDGFDLKAYNDVIKLMSESTFKPMFGN